MQNVTDRARIREMSAEELQEHVDEIYSRHNGDFLEFSPEEHDEFKQCASNYYQLTGEALVAKNTNPQFQFI